MHIYIVYAHPADVSFHREVLQTFTKGLEEAGHSYELGDLYKMNFQTNMNADQYQREVSMDPLAPLPEDVMQEQEKVNRADALVFIYPVWWSDCPAILKGWFDKVWSHGYAYYYDELERRTQISIKKALVICAAGHPLDHLEEIGIAKSMRTIMLNDRLLGIGVQEAKMEILGGMMPNDDSMKAANLESVYRLAKEYFG